MFVVTQGLGGSANDLLTQGYGLGEPAPQVSGSLFAQILLALVAQLAAKNVLPSTSIGLSLTRQPSSSVIANSYITITPGREQAIPEQAYGLGRYGSGMDTTAWVNLYCRVALDSAYQDYYFLTDSSGLRALVWSVTDALQLFLPVDDNGHALTEEPVRFLGNPKTMKYRKSREWGYLSLPLQIRYAKQCTTSILL